MPKCDVLDVELVKAIEQAIEHQEESEITNEEWFCLLSTKEKATVVVDVMCEIKAFYSEDSYAEQFEKWLKEKHNGNT